MTLFITGQRMTLHNRNMQKNHKMLNFSRNLPLLDIDAETRETISELLIDSPTSETTRLECRRNAIVSLTIISPTTFENQGYRLKYNFDTEFIN